MADDDSWSERKRSDKGEKKPSTTQEWGEAWDSMRKEVADWRYMGLRRRKSRLSLNSRESSREVRLRSGADEITLAESTKLPPEPLFIQPADMMSSTESLHDYHNSPSIQLQNYLDPSGMSSGSSLSRSEIQRSSSLLSRSPTVELPSESQGVVKRPISGPLNIFLDRTDEFTDLGQDLTATEEDWKRLRALRSSVLRHRAQLRLERRELKAKQLAKTFADENFMKYVRSKISSAQHEQLFSPVLDSYYHAMQIARDQYGPAEDDYDAFEDRVDEVEFELAKIEGRIYDFRNGELAMVATGQDLAATDTLQSPEPSDSLLGLSTKLPKEYHPIHVRYLSRLGDLDLAIERHQNMMQEHEGLTAMQTARRIVGMEVNNITEAFLAQFPAKNSELLAEIAEIEADVLRLKEECLVEGIDIGESEYQEFEDCSSAKDDHGSNQ